MKTKKITKTCITLIAVLMITMIVKQVSAQNYLIIDLNTISNYDSVYYCADSYDSIMIVSNSHNNSNNWYFSYTQETLLNHDDTLAIFSGSVGYISWNNANLVFKDFFIVPVVFSCMGSTTITCGGNATLDDIMPYGGTDTVTYSWLPLSGLDNPNIHNPIASPVTTTTYTVTAIYKGCVVIDSATIYVNPFSITGLDGMIICGDSVILNTTNNYGGTGTLTYSWLPITGLNNSAIANPLATITVDQTYSVSASSVNGCMATDSVYVSVIPMDAPDVCIVGVDSSNKNMIVWNKPLITTIDSFYVYRETDITGVYEKIGTVPYDSMSIFIDQFSFPNIQSNKYKISIKDHCGFESAHSEYHKTMHLAINQGMGNTWNLIWDPYEGFNVSTYKIYRGSSPDSIQLIGTTSGGNTQYSDFSAPSGYVYYQVEVISPNSCSPVKTYNSSRSNIATNNPDGIHENNDSSILFSIFPNPATENLTIQTHQKAIIEILNIAGQSIMTINDTDTFTTIDIKDLSSGVYIVKVRTDEGSAVKKFIKE